MMPTLLLTILASLITTSLTQVCQNGEIVFLVDLSENAMYAASTSDRPTNTDKFDLLRSALDTALSNLLIASSSTLRIGAFGYSSDNQPTMIPLGTSPADARNMLRMWIPGFNGGSWTYRGLDMITAPPTTSNNRLVILSTQGSSTSTRLALALASYNRVKALGWNIYVIVIKGDNPVNYEELNFGANAVVANVTDPNPINPANPKSYRYLAPELTKQINSVCLPVATTSTTKPAIQTTATTKTTATSTTTPSTATTTRTTTPSACQPIEIVFLLDQSENARKASTDKSSGRQFNFLRDAIQRFLWQPDVLIALYELRIDIYGFSGNSSVTFYSRRSYPEVSLFLMDNIKNNKETWLYKGLEVIDYRPTHTNNRLVIITSQTSETTAVRLHTQRELSRVKALGWIPLVIAVKGENELNLDELTCINGGRRPIILDDLNDKNPQSYRLLPMALQLLLDNVFCQGMQSDVLKNLCVE